MVIDNIDDYYQLLFHHTQQLSEKEKVLIRFFSSNNLLWNVGGMRVTGGEVWTVVCCVVDEKPLGVHAHPTGTSIALKNTLKPR